MIEKATLAGGCFWCTEAIFLKLRGVISVKSGYSGGKIANPTYEQVCGGQTGHVEAIQIEFNSDIIDFDQLLDVFFATHDPTTKNRQGADIGSQYQSVIFYHNQKQKEIAGEKIRALNQSGQFSTPIVTEVYQYQNFYEAESYHQKFYENNKDSFYCRLVIDPKIKKLISQFSSETTH